MSPLESPYLDIASTMGGPALTSSRRPADDLGSVRKQLRVRADTDDDSDDDSMRLKEAAVDDGAMVDEESDEEVRQALELMHKKKAEKRARLQAIEVAALETDLELASRRADDAELRLDVEIVRNDALVGEITELQAALEEAKQRGAQYADEVSGSLGAESQSHLRGLLDKAEDQLTECDRALLSSFLSHAYNKRAPYKDEIVKDVAIHFATMLGMREYLLLAELWRLPRESWIKAHRRDLRKAVHLGTMHRQWDALALDHNGHLFIYVHDETRAIARLDGIVGDFGAKIVGEGWSPDPRKHPSLSTLPDIPTSFVELRDFARTVVENDRLAVNVEVGGAQPAWQSCSLRPLQAYVAQRTPMCPCASSKRCRMRARATRRRTRSSTGRALAISPRITKTAPRARRPTGRS